MAKLAMRVRGEKSPKSISSRDIRRECSRSAQNLGEVRGGEEGREEPRRGRREARGGEEMGEKKKKEEGMKENGFMCSSV